VGGLGWKAIQDPVLCKGEWDEAFPDHCRELGMLAAAGLDAGIY
ncbi:MAG TPA: flavodoxin, partial [Rhodospirillaceae bacterium]|nr:flavodoxin [Rhodospirillaceae bacterium]